MTAAGKIIKGIAGFYYVYVRDLGLYECKARGLFRKDNKKPLVGDDVTIEILDEKDREGNITEIHPRKNQLIRPASANVDQALILFAHKDPKPNFLLLDRFLISMTYQKVPVLAAFNKADLDAEAAFERIAEDYREAGCPIISLSIHEGRGLEDLSGYLAGKTTVLAGPSGVGKSSLTNALQDTVRMEVGEISRKLARGKNTTRHAELIPLEDGFLMDTPGFSAFEGIRIPKEEIEDYYPEFASYRGKCYYQGCAHKNEPNCAVKAAVEEGLISPLRYRNYTALYDEAYEEEKRRYR